MAKARLEALKARMNPHFIANTLTSIRNMLYKDHKDDAILYLTKFAKLIRTTLENSSNEFITLAAEIEYISVYLSIETLRFEDKFKTKIVVSPELRAPDILVPPTIFQPFIENAINHGLMHRKSDGMLSIGFGVSDNLLKCTIEDNGVGRKRARELENHALIGHTSRSESITFERIDLMNKIFNTSDYSINLIDIQDNNDNVCGTRVEITLPLHYIYKADKP